MTAKQNRKQLKYRPDGRTVWLSDNHAWEITRDEKGHHLTDWRPNGSTRCGTFTVVPKLYDDRALSLSRTHQTWPTYVIEAMRLYCTEAQS